MSTVTTSPLAACCATNVPRDVRPAGASTSPAAPPRREITVRSISSAVCRARSSISRVEGPPEVVVLDSGVCQVCSVGVDPYDQLWVPVGYKADVCVRESRLKLRQTLLSARIQAAHSLPLPFGPA